MLTFNLPGVYEALDLVMKYYPDRFTDETKIEIETLFTHCLEGLSDDSEKFLSTLFIKSLKNYIGPTIIDEHIYLKKYEIPQIQLFNILIKEFPFVKIGHEITNDIIIEKLKGKKEATILDIGIGQGLQVKHLLAKIKESKSLEYLRIIGIEPFKEALEMTEDSIRKDISDMPFKVEFVGINAFIEKMEGKELAEIIGTKTPNLMINESLALHHIQSLDDRNKVIKNLYQLNPAALLLTEPNVDHYEPDFYRRFQNCYRHFYNVFQVIDTLDIPNIDKNALKLFFGREIEDIIGKHNDKRYEKHEPAFRWIEKLKNNGFKINTTIFKVPENIATGVKSSIDSEGFLGFTYESETILAIICAEA